jgi:exodeoxyribonuclease VII small subunit
LAQKKSQTFASKMKRLEQIVEELETDSADLEKAIAIFEEGVALTKECEKILREAEKKVEILLKDAQGNVTSSEFDPGLEEDEPDA